MRGNYPRTQLLLALILDCVGQFLIFYFLLRGPLSLFSPSQISPQFEFELSWLLFCLFLYPLLGWLFGSYTILRWRHLAFPVLLQRLLITSTVTLMVIAIARWLANHGEDIWILTLRFQLVWLSLLTVCSLFIRLSLRRGLFLPELPRLLLLASDDEVPLVLNAWTRLSSCQCVEPITPLVLEQLLCNSQAPLLVALSSTRRSDPSISSLIELLELQDPRSVQTISLTSLFELQQERLPPVLLSDSDLLYDDLPWVAQFSIQAQLKRLADLFVAAVLLLLTAPFVALAAVLICLEDQGPVFYKQQRSGWLGRPFTLFKLRTMRVHDVADQSLWTQPGDQRITSVGQWLRRLRLDELPQLLNVLNGEMSLIGPRPERPELERNLNRHIPHYRKRHWMRPGLSGWAQVCAPYASSIADSDFKLSYDLYYLRHFSTWLDLVILFRTLKTVLKAGGR